MKTVLDGIIDETQFGFMRNRHISNNIWLVLDILDYPELVNNESFILFLDFYKAFDSTEHEFIFKTLNLVLATFFAEQLKHYTLMEIAQLN